MDIKDGLTPLMREGLFENLGMRINFFKLSFSVVNQGKPRKPYLPQNRSHSFIE
jgi:hypothetical protein